MAEPAADREYTKHDVLEHFDQDPADAEHDHRSELGIDLGADDDLGTRLGHGRDDTPSDVGIGLVTFRVSDDLFESRSDPGSVSRSELDTRRRRSCEGCEASRS